MARKATLYSVQQGGLGYILYGKAYILNSKEGWTIFCNARRFRILMYG